MDSKSMPSQALAMLEKKVLAFPTEQHDQLLQDALKKAGCYLASPAIPHPAETRRVGARRSQKKHHFARLALAAAMLSEYNRWRKSQKRMKKQGDDIQAWSPPDRTGLEPAPAEIHARPKVILFGLHWLDYGGAEKFAIDCIQVAQQHAFCIVLTDVASSHPLKSKIQSDRVRYIHAEQLKAYKPALEKNIRAELLKALLKNFDVSTVHIHHCMWLYDNLDLIKKISPRSKVMDTLHIIEHDRGGYPLISCARSKYIDIHHVISQKLADYIKVKTSRFEGVHVAKLLDSPSNCKETPNIAHAKSSEIRITFVGRMDYQKRPRLFVAFAQRLIKEAPKIGVKPKFTMVGNGRLRAETQKLIDDLGLHQIEIMPPDAPVTEILSGSDFLILPSENEGIPLVAYEAIANGCIPICTDVGGNQEICGSWVVNANPFLTVSEASKMVINLAKSPADFMSAWQMMRNNFVSQSKEVNGIHFCESIYKNAI